MKKKQRITLGISVLILLVLVFLGSFPLACMVWKSGRTGLSSTQHSRKSTVNIWGQRRAFT